MICNKYNTADPPDHHKASLLLMRVYIHFTVFHILILMKTCYK